jgi:hypothetical protein
LAHSQPKDGGSVSLKKTRLPTSTVTTDLYPEKAIWEIQATINSCYAMQGTHYLIGLKKNQPKLYAAVESYTIESGACW